MGSTRKLTLMMMVLITVGAVDSIRNIPTTALFGPKIIAFFLIASVFFLIPAALISAELAAQFPEDNGIYDWVKHAFGPRWGFIAVWLQWVENVPFFPAILSFIIGTIIYMFSPGLANDKTVQLILILGIFWTLTFVNIFGIRLSASFSSFCTMIGLVIPMILLISMGSIWYFSGRQLAIHLTLQNMTPHFSHLSVWVTMQGVLLSLCGIELATVHAKDTINPKRTFPLALIISVTIIILTLVMGALSVAWVVPAKDLSLVTGIMDTFSHFLASYHLNWLLPILAIMIAVGSLGGVNSWIIAPTRGLRVACEEGHFPKWFAKENKHKMPATILIFQAILVSIIIGAFILIPSVNGAYWLLSVLAAQLYMMMYILMFLASFKLKCSNPTKPDHYHIPGGFFGHTLVAFLGFLGSVGAFLICFIPPHNVSIGSESHYEMLLVLALVVLTFLPLAFKLSTKK
jgi:amino acid transporter